MPSKYYQVGKLGADKDLCGLEDCKDRYGPQAHSVRACAEHCDNNDQCESFTYAPLDGDVAYKGQRVCTLYKTTDFPKKTTGVDGTATKIACRKCTCEMDTLIFTPDRHQRQKRIHILLRRASSHISCVLFQSPPPNTHTHTHTHTLSLSLSLVRAHSLSDKFELLKGDAWCDSLYSMEKIERIRLGRDISLYECARKVAQHKGCGDYFAFHTNPGLCVCGVANSLNSDCNIAPEKDTVKYSSSLYKIRGSSAKRVHMFSLGNCAHNNRQSIDSKAECEAAAQHLGLPSTERTHFLSLLLSRRFVW